MKKRILAALLAVAMLACSLAACATSDTPSTTAPSTSGGSTADTAKTTEPASAEKPKETITLKLWGGVQPEYGYQECATTSIKSLPIRASRWSIPAM